MSRAVRRKATGAETTRAGVLVAAGAAAAVAGRTVWSQLSLTVAAGEFVAVLGPNGAGESTLLRAVLGQVPVRAGTLRVLGATPGSAGSRVGYLPQRSGYPPATRVRGTDIVRLGWDGHRWGTPVPPWLGGRRAREGAARVREVVELVGAAGYVDRPVGQCSGGEQQRLLLAQVLVRRPELLLLDEPLDSLDVTNQASISALVHRLCRDQGVAVVMVAHDVNPIVGYLDRVVYLANGRAVTGPPERVITADTLTALYGTSIDVLRDRTGRLVVVGQPDAPADHRPARLHPFDHRPAEHRRAGR